MGESPWFVATFFVAFALDCFVFHLRPLGLLTLRPSWWHLRLGQSDGGVAPSLETLQTVRMPSLLVFYAVGSAEATVEQVVRNVARLREQGISFSLFLAHYDGKRQRWLRRAGEAWYLENVHDSSEIGGYKLQILSVLLEARKLEVRNFRWVWTLDEDVDLAQAEVPKLLELADRSGALLVSPAYKSRWHQVMVRNTSCEFRYTTFLEVSFPLIRPDALMKLLDKALCQHCLHKRTVWGLDSIWCAWSARQLGYDRMQGCAVIDAAPVVHGDFRTLAGKYRKKSKISNRDFQQQALADQRDVLMHHAADRAASETDLECVSSVKEEAAPKGEMQAQRWAICIVGQLSRLEVESKLQNLFAELARKGAEVDAYFVLELRAKVFSNRDTDYGVNNTNCSRDPMKLQALKERFHPWYKVGEYSRHNRSVFKEVNLSRWRSYQRRFPDRRQKLANDITQMGHIATCEALIRKHEGNRPYTDVLRIRDNAVVTLPFPSELVRFPGIAVKRAQNWAGLNDKALYAARQFLTPAFAGALELAMQINTGTVPKHLYNLTKRIKNSEALLSAALQSYPVSQLPSSKMVFVDGRCYGPRHFCLVPAWKDMPPPLPGLWAQPCIETLNVSGEPVVLPRKRRSYKGLNNPTLLPP